MSELVTLSRSNPEFNKFLLGDVDNKVVLPVRTIQPNTPNEMVTFRVVDQVAKPFFWWLSIVRPDSLVLNLVPLIYVILHAQSYLALNALLAWMGVNFLHIAAFCFNDYSDHMRGLDRDLAYSGSRAIQQGFVSAKNIYRIGMFLIGATLITGGLILWQQPGVLYLLGAVALFGVLSYASDRVGVKYRAGGELVIFLLFGPILTAGYSIAVSGNVSAQVITFGIFWGFILSVEQMLRNFSHGMFYERAGVKTVIQVLGFEKSRHLIAALFFIGLASLVVMAFTMNIGYFYAAAVYSGICGILLYNLFRIQSPVSSVLDTVRSGGRQLCIFTGCSLVLVELVDIWLK